jgi:hypothetical protein
MAKPISATPILRGKQATDFLNRVYSDAKKPLGYVPTPKLVEAEKLIKKISADGKKCIR